ncbi:MAG: hypothetical protein EA352_10285 [Gemmatimonadales bacterium]|nr:MAG: hypothetical protein EA352_10285 [Gemmatimonadales bacterium]
MMRPGGLGRLEKTGPMKVPFWIRVSALCLAVLFTATSCVGPAEPMEAIIWEGQVQSTPAAEDPFTASVAMVAEQQITRLGIGMEAAPPDRSWGWRLFSGTCAAPGDGLVPASAFPPIVTGENGQAESDMIIQRRLPRGGTYVVQVFEQPDASGEVKGCGELAVVDNPEFGAADLSGGETPVF